MTKVGVVSCACNEECVFCCDSAKEVKCFEEKEEEKGKFVKYHFAPLTEAKQSKLCNDYCSENVHESAYMCEDCWHMMIWHGRHTCPMCRAPLKPPPSYWDQKEEKYDAKDFRVNIIPSAYGGETRLYLSILNEECSLFIQRITGKERFRDIRGFFSPTFKLYYLGVAKEAATVLGFELQMSVGNEGLFLYSKGITDRNGVIAKHLVGEDWFLQSNTVADMCDVVVIENGIAHALVSMQFRNIPESLNAAAYFEDLMYYFWRRKQDYVIEEWNDGFMYLQEMDIEKIGKRRTLFD